MKKALLKKQSPQPAAVVELHEDTASNETAPSIVTPGDSGDLSRRAVDHGDLLSSLAAYIRVYLVCNDHQLTILALWTLYTWCYNYFPTATYLDVHSPAPQSGKTRCLQILYGLCRQPDLIAGADARTAMHRLLRPCRTVEQIAAGEKTGPHTFLFDDCHFALNTSERQPLLALLNSGTGIFNYSVLSADYMVFGPKAFAASAPLPRSLASRCIPIKLRRNKPSEKADYFALGKHHVVTQNQPQNGDNDCAFQLPNSLERWAEANREPLQQTHIDAITARPQGLSPAQQDCAEPLLRIADRIGGHWPRRARAAIAVLLDLPQFDPALQLLADIRNCFLAKNNPKKLATRDILAWLLNLDNRPWSTGTTTTGTTRSGTARSLWHSNSGTRLGALLRPHGISSRTLHERDKDFKGYLRSDFQDAWERYLKPLSARPASAGRGANREPAANGSNQSVLNPFTPNPNEINAPNGRTE
jgi:hypothetical protein